MPMLMGVEVGGKQVPNPPRVNDEMFHTRERSAKNGVRGCLSAAKRKNIGSLF
jgi:hypothetical protein